LQKNLSNRLHNKIFIISKNIRMRSCPICGNSSKNAMLFLEENINPALLSGFSYASRKKPEYMSHRLVKCRRCQLIYAPDPPSQDELAKAYHNAEYDSSDEASDAAQSYINAISPILARLGNKCSVLEIGSGTGIFLELVKNEGFRELIGIEPSTAAIAAAPPHRREWLYEGIFKEELFKAASFDLICCFMTLEHMRNPKDTALSAWRLLRPGGAFVTVTHDYGSFINKMLGKKSPIIDLEHMQLFSKTSIYELYKRSGFTEISSKPLINRYSLKYWIRLAPLPALGKHLLEWISIRTGIGCCKLSVNVGNTITVGFRKNFQQTQVKDAK
jgi:SAM-dependent methyltransferase